MPFVYGSTSKQVAENFTTNGTANTETDHFFLKPGTRNTAVNAIYVGGKGAGLTAISGIAYRVKKWTTTASAGGTAITPAPRDIGMQAAKATAAGSVSAGVTAGTGGPTQLLAIVSGAAGPGGWVAPNPDSTIVVEGSANQSTDLSTSSGTVALSFEFSVEHFE